MERVRTKKEGVIKLPKWKVLSGGITLLDRRSFTAGEVFEAYENDIPVAFRDIIQPLQPTEEMVARKKTTYSLSEVVATAEEQDADAFVQLYDIVNSEGKVISQKPLSKEEATPLLQAFNA